LFASKHVNLWIAYRKNGNDLDLQILNIDSKNINLVHLEAQISIFLLDFSEY
jgi:hypothetical protein